MIPKTIEEVLDPNNRISEYADNSEIAIWMTWMHYAVSRASEDLGVAKIELEIAENAYEIEYGKQYSTIEADDVTTRKIKATICESVVEKKNAVIYLKYRYNMASAAVAGVIERASCIRKIATLRSNMTKISEDGIYNNNKINKNNNEVSHYEQPYNPNTFMQ